MDTYVEYLVKRKKRGKDFAVIAATIIGALLIMFLATALYATPFGSFVLLIQAGALYLGYRLLGYTNIEFEYCVTGGDLDIDKIINRQKRTRLVSVSSKSIISMAPAGSSNLAPIGDRKVIDATSGKGDKTVYCVIYGEGKGNALIFEPTEKMVTEMQRHNPRNIFVD